MTFEQEMAAGIAAAKVRLRFDKVVVRLIDGLKAGLAEVVPDDQTFVFTLTAPIKRPAKTGAAIEALVRDGILERDLSITVHSNRVRLRRVAGVLADMPRVAGFVHSSEVDASLILDLAETSLRGPR